MYRLFPCGSSDIRCEMEDQSVSLFFRYLFDEGLRDAFLDLEIEGVIDRIPFDKSRHRPPKLAGREHHVVRLLFGLPNGEKLTDR